MRIHLQIIAIVLVALAFRLALLHFSWDINPVFDEIAYTDNARQILAHGDFAGAYRPPLYSYFLAGLMMLFGQSMYWMKLVQVVIGSLTTFLVYLSAKEIASEKVAVLAALIYALDPNMAWFSCFFWPETLFMAPFLLSFYLLARNVKSGKTGWFLAAGMLFGIAALIKSMILYFMVFVVIWIVVFHKKGKMKTAAAFLAGAVLMISPWTIRNYHETGAFVPIDTNGMYNLYAGNNEIKGYGSDVYWTDRMKEINERYSAFGSTEVERESGARAEAIKYIMSQPNWLLKKFHGEMPMLWAPAYHPLRHIKMGFYGALNPYLVNALVALVILSYFFLAISAVFGFINSESGPGVWWVLGLVVYMCAVYTVTYGTPRYCFIAWPFLTAFSGLALAERRKIIATGFSPRNIAAGLLSALLIFMWYGSYTYQYFSLMVHF